MRQSSIFKWLWLAPLALAACTRQNVPTAKDHNPDGLLRATALNPVPADRESLESQLKRFRGQTKFLNYHYVSQFRALAEAAPGGASQAYSSQRAVQESDIYKVGKPGSKLLFLLNSYRGLQVVSFADGADKPKLLGRIEATGNDPQDMYYVPAQDRLYVLERLWFDGSDAYARQRDSRVLVYDVSNPQAPKLAGEERIAGELADSRLVGDVLYVATSEWPSYWWETRSSQSKAKGHVFSFHLKQDKLEKIAQEDLQSPISGRENMNIVEVEKNGGYQYYLVAILSDSPWGWWDRKSSVEVVDISDPNGQIKTVMSVTAKGAVNKRSQTFIKNDTLIVTSNYDGEKLRRVAVETFRFPSTDPQIITDDEATFRKLYIQREVAKVNGENEKDARYEALVSDATLGLRGRFVKQGDTWQKLVADSTVTIGDTHGLNADLQDVRVSGNLLYAFWVPANSKDPLDVFDLSAPEKGVSHLGHTEFEGWVERAEPVLFQGKQYVVGLGWIVPATDEHSRRVPQAVLFEITQRQPSRTVKAEVVAQTNLGTSDVWADFSRGDKFTEFNIGADGKGVILFSIDSWGEKYVQGGKLVGVDLNAASQGRDDVFTDGTVLAGNPGWLRRVFTNTEINAKNAFSDLALSTYAVPGVGSARELARAVSVLELARNLRGYVTVGGGETLRGVQILTNSRWETGADSDQTELRAVDATRADTEKPGVLATAVLTGNYLSHIVTGHGSVLVLTNEYKTKKAEGDHPATSYTEYRLSEVTPNGNTFRTTDASWQYTYRPATGGNRFFIRPWGYQAPKVVEVEAGKYLVSTGEDIHLVTSTATGLAVTNVDASGCVPVNVPVSAALVGGKLYATFTTLIDDPSRDKVKYERHFVASAALDGTGRLACGPSLNIPGQLLADGKALVAEDNRLEDLIESKSQDGKTTYYTPIQKTALVSLKVNGQAATLVDLYDPNGVQATAMKPVGDGTFAFVENGDQDYGTPEFVLLGLDEEARFTKETFGLRLALGSHVALASTFADTKPGAYLAVVTGGRRAQVLGWTAAVHRPTVKSLVGLNERFEKGQASETVGLFETYRFSSWYGESNSLHFTPSLRSLEFAEDEYGVKQVLVQE